MQPAVAARPGSAHRPGRRPGQPRPANARATREPEHAPALPLAPGRRGLPAEESQDAQRGRVPGAGRREEPSRDSGRRGAKPGLHSIRRAARRLPSLTGDGRDGLGPRHRPGPGTPRSGADAKAGWQRGGRAGGGGEGGQGGRGGAPRSVKSEGTVGGPYGLKA